MPIPTTQLQTSRIGEKVIIFSPKNGKNLAEVVQAEAKKLRRYSGMRHLIVKNEGSYAVLKAGRNYFVELSAEGMEAEVIGGVRIKGARITVNGTGVGAVPQHVLSALVKTCYSPQIVQSVPLDALYLLG